MATVALAAALSAPFAGCAWIIGVNEDPVQVGGPSQPTPTPTATATTPSDASTGPDGASDGGGLPD